MSAFVCAGSDGGSLFTGGLELVGWWAMLVPWHAHGALTGVGLCRAPTRV